MAEPEEKISVVMCTYNGARFLREQLDSILNQTLLPAEIIVQDDGSSDETLDILKEYAAKTTLVKIYQNEGAHGINSNFFTAMQRASGDLIALSDQDDIWEADKLRLQTEAIGDKLLCSGFSEPFSTEGYPVSFDRRRPNYHILRLAYLGALPGHTFLMRKELPCYLKNWESSPYLYDWQLQMVAAAAESIAFVDETLVHFRRHAGAATANIPVANQLASASTFHYISVTFLHHRQLQVVVRERFQHILRLLDSLPFHTESVAECREMAQLQVGRSFWNFLCRTAFFVRHREVLFYVRESGGWLTFFRALFFPFSCGYYYRGILKRNK